MQQSTLEAFETTEPDVPYEIPTPGLTQTVHQKHREWYWDEHDYEAYECPDCDRGSDEVDFDVHHIDQDYRNGAPENLIGLCDHCHYMRHKRNSTRERVSEWKENLLSVGSA